MTISESQLNRKEKLADFAALCAWLIASITMAVIAYAQFGQDFRGYFAAAKVLLAGGNPYDYYQVAPVLMEATGRVGNNPFYYPLWFGWTITPLSLVPFQIARAIWMGINLALWILGLTRLHQLLEWPHTGWRTWSMNLLATFIFAWSTWKFEQTGILLFLITVEIIISHRRKQQRRMGIFLALALIKPNIMLLPVAVLCLWLLRNKIYRPVLVMSALLACLVILTTILTPDWYQPLLLPNFGQGLTEVLDGPNKTTGIRLNTTMSDWLKMLQVPYNIGMVIFGLTIAIGLIVIAGLIWNTRSFLETTVVALLVNFAITPYALQYDFPPLTIPFFWALALAVQSGSIRFPTFIVTFIASVLIWERPISDGYWIVIGLCILAYWSIKITDKTKLPGNLV
jgi:hypothetical protein